MDMPTKILRVSFGFLARPVRPEMFSTGNIRPRSRSEATARIGRPGGDRSWRRWFLAAADQGIGGQSKGDSKMKFYARKINLVNPGNGLGGRGRNGSGGSGHETEIRPHHERERHHAHGRAQVRRAGQGQNQRRDHRGRSIRPASWVRTRRSSRAPGWDPSTSP